MNYKDLAENILSDIMGNGSISDILLKAKIFASKKGDNDLLAWISKELNGYEGISAPKYRILPSGLKVDVFVPFRGTSRIDFPAEMIKNKEVRERLSDFHFNNPIAEIEGLCKTTSDAANLYSKVHAYAFQFMSEFINGDIQGAYQVVTKASVSQILVAVKSVLIDFFLKVSSEEDIDFSTFVKNNPNMTPNIQINAGIVNTGNGIINASGSTNIVGDNNIINEKSKEELLRIITQIDKIASEQPNSDYDDVSRDIKAEIAKEYPSKSYLKRCFQAIPSFFTGISTGVVANGITPLVKDAVERLSQVL